MTARFHISLRAILITIVVVGVLHAQEKLPETPPGKIVRRFIETFNAADDGKMRQFFLDNVSKSGLEEQPVESRIEGMKMFRSDAKSLAVMKLLDASPLSISVVAKAGNGETLTLTFNFDKNDKFAGLRIELGEQSPSTGPPMSGTELVAAVEQYLTERTRDDKFSGAVLIAHDTTILFKKAYGDADKRFNVPNRTDTKFNIGSINKFFTRLAIVQLAEQGKLLLDEPVITYLPDYPNWTVAEKIKINQLLSMKSGMGDVFGQKFENTPKDKIRALEDYLEFFVNDTLLFEPGTQRRYSNAGFIVLGLIVEKLTGQDYYSYVREHVFHPAGMANTGWYASDEVVPNIATGYEHPERDDHTWISNIHTLPGRGSSAGGGYTTVDDMLTFIHELLQGKFLSPKYTEWMLTNNLPANDARLPLKRGSIGIAGGTGGVNAAVEFDAETGTIVIVLSNYSPPSAEEVDMKIMGWMKRMK